jgi:hypothetical protein
MKRISRFALVTLFSLLVIGSTRVFAGDGGNQGQNNQGNNNKGGNNNQGNGGGIIGWIDNLLNDIFGNDNNQGNNNNGGNKGGNDWGGNPTTGGGTAPIDGGITLLLGAGIGLGLTKVVRVRRG